MFLTTRSPPPSLQPPIGLRALLLLCCCFMRMLQIINDKVIMVDALAPPHPDYYVDWEPVHAMRRRLNITYNYDPIHLPAEHCRYLTERICKREDEAHGAVRAARRRNNNLLQQEQYGNDGGQNHRPRRRLNPSVGTFKVLVLLVRFDGHQDHELPPAEYFDELFNGRGPGGANTVGSVSDFLRYSSVAQYNVEFTVQPWFQLPEGSTEEFWARGTSGQYSNEELAQMFTPALDAMDQAGFGWIPFTTEGWFSHLIVIHSGYGAEFGDSPDGCANAAKDRLWSRGSSGLGDNAWVSRDGLAEVSGFVISSAFQDPLCDSTPNNLGIIAHEIMHGLAVYDLYDAGGDLKIAGVGRFDIMALPYGWKRDLSRPGHLSAYSRLEAGWLSPIEITQNGIYAIQPAELSGQAFVIKQGYPEGEYMLLENRQPLKWSEDWPGGGILILHVDEAVPGQINRGYPGSEGFPENHYRVVVQPADRNYDLEQGNNVGDVGDLWTKGMTLGPGGDYPNTDAYQGGNVRQTGISITILTESNFIMLFQVDGLGDSDAGGSGAAATFQGSGQAAHWQEQDLDQDQQQLGSGVLGGAPNNGDSTYARRTITWILSMLGGAALMVGLLIVILF